MEKMEKILLTKELINEILNYLSTKPYHEVEKMIAQIFTQAQAQSQKEEN